MKRIILCLILSLFLCYTANATLTYDGTYYRDHISQARTGTATDPIYLFINEVEESLEGGGGVDSLVFTPGTEPSSVSEGEVYYDDASNGLLLYNGSVWVTIDTAGASSLDTAYNTGSTIDVDGDAVTLTVSDTDNNRVLDLVQNDTTYNPETIRITNTGSGDTLQFVSTGGKDIDGTSSSWSVTHAGVGTFLGVDIGGSDIVLENDEIIHNTADTEIGFKATEDIVIDLDSGTNIVGWKSNTGVVGWDFGDVDALTGINTIAFDGAVANTITQTGTGAGDDLTIAQACSAQNASLILNSSGTGTDALKMNASAGGIDIDATGSTIGFTNTADGSGDDFTIEVEGDQDASLILQSDGTGGDAVSIITSATTGDIKINSGDMIDIDAADKVTIDVAGAATEDIILTNTGGSIALSATEDATDAINIDATAGGIDIDAVGEAGQDIVVTNTGGSIGLSASEAATDAVSITASAGGITMTSTAEAASWTQTSTGTDDNLTLAVAGATASSLILSSAGTGTDAVDLNATAGGIDVDSALDVAIDLSGAGSNFDVDSAAGSIYLDAGEAAANAIAIQATAGGIDIDTVATYDIDMDATGGKILMTATENAANTIAIEENGGTSGGINIYSNQGVGVAATTEHDASIQLHSDDGGIGLYTTANLANAIRIETNGGASETINISAVKGTGTSSIDIDSTVGGITIAANAAGKDIGINSVLGSIAIEAEENAANALLLVADGDTASTLKIHNDTGSSVTEGAASVEILSDAGGVELRSTANLANAIMLTVDNDTTSSMLLFNDTGTSVTEGSASIEILSDAGGVELRSTANLANAINLTADGDTTTTMTIFNDTGTSSTEKAAAIQLLSDVGSVELWSGLNSSDAINIMTDGSTASGIMIFNDTGTSVTEGTNSIQLLSDAGGIGIESNANLDDAIYILLDGDTTSEMSIQNDTGTAEDSIEIVSDVGGINVTAGSDDDLDLSGGQVNLASTQDVASAIALTANTGSSETIVITNTNGVSVTEGSNAIQLLASAGGIGIESNANLDDAIYILADGGTTSEITIQNDLGTATDSIEIISDAGGIDITTGADDDLDLSGGQVNLVSQENAASAIALTTNVGTSETIVVTNTQGNGTGAITLLASAGGIDIDAKDDIIITNNTTAAGDDLKLVVDGDDNASIELNSDGTAADAILLTVETGGITMTASHATGGDVLIDAEDDVTIDSEGKVTISSATASDNGDIKLDAEAASIYLDAGQDVADAISLVCSGGDGGIDITSLGDIDITTTGADGEDITITNTGGSITLEATQNADDAIYIHENGGASGSVKIHADQGTSADSIYLLSDGGGINATATANTGASAAAEYDAAIQLYAPLGGIGLLSGLNADDSIRIETNGGDDENITVRSNQGTDTDSIYILSDEGGIEIEATASTAAAEGASAVQLTASAGAIELLSGLNATNAIKLTVDSDTAGAIDIYNDTGSASDSIHLLSDVGGIDLNAGTDITITVGGDFCIVDDDMMSFGTADDVTLNYDEDGEDNLQVKGPVDLETTYVQFREEPVCVKKNGAGAPTGTAGDENLLMAGFPACTFEYHIVGTATDVAPDLGTYGLDIGLDDDEDDGIEITEGITARSRSAFTVGTDAFYLEMVVYVTDGDGSDVTLFGFRADEAYQADPEDYTDMASVALNGVDWYVWTIDDDGATGKTDVTPAGGDCGDGESHTIRIEVAANRACTFYIDGAEPTSSPSHSIDDTDVVVPFFYLIHDSTTAEAFQITSWECGLL